MNPTMQILATLLRRVSALFNKFHYPSGFMVPTSVGMLSGLSRLAGSSDPTFPSGVDRGLRTYLLMPLGGGFNFGMARSGMR